MLFLPLLLIVGNIITICKYVKFTFKIIDVVKVTQKSILNISKTSNAKPVENIKLRNVKLKLIVNNSKQLNS